MKAIIVPIHPPSFSFALDLINSASGFKNITFFFIFSSTSDYELFTRYYNFENNCIRYLILKDFAISSSVITRKKWLALDIIFNQLGFSEAFVIDAECQILEENKVLKAFDNLSKREFIYCINTENPNSNNIMRICQNFFNNDDRLKLENLFFFDNYSPHRTPSCKYFWFNDIPYYEKNGFNQMCNYFDFKNQKSLFNVMDSYWAFDYILYVFFLSISGKIAPISNGFLFNYPGSLVEQGYLFNKSKYSIILEKFQAHWSSNFDVTNEKVCILFHKDRLAAKVSFWEKIRGQKKLNYILY